MFLVHTTHMSSFWTEAHQQRTLLLHTYNQCCRSKVEALDIFFKFKFYHQMNGCVDLNHNSKEKGIKQTLLFDIRCMFLILSCSSSFKIYLLTIPKFDLRTTLKRYFFLTFLVIFTSWHKCFHLPSTALLEQRKIK